jgi:F-type H+-transporting ATPase subunit b
MSAFEILVASQAWAAAAEAEHEAISINQIWFPLGNFIIFAWIIKRFALPLIRDFLRSRHAQVISSIQTAAETRQRAAATVEDYKARLARLEQEVQSIQASLRAEGEREKARLLEEAQVLARKINDDTRFLADQEVKIARQKIREEIATQAESIARELIQRNFTPADQSHLTEEFIRGIGQSR